MGWSRFVSYIKRRIIRLNDTPRNVAVGLAMGLSCSFNPFVGTHILQACLFAYLLRANLPAAALGTILGNPTTFPFFWWAAISVGSFLLNLAGFSVGSDLSGHGGFEELLSAAGQDMENILLPWVVGAYVIGLALLPISYGVFYPLVSSAQRARQKLIALRGAYLAKQAEKKQKDPQ